MDNPFGKIPQMFNGFRVVESTMAMETVPVRRHKKTMAKSDFYHDRIQKKWNKRFGFKQVPGIYMIDTSKLTFGDLNGGEKVIMAHPEMVARLKELPTGTGFNEKHPKPDIGFKPSYGQSPLKEVFRPKGIIDLDTSA